MRNTARDEAKRPHPVEHELTQFHLGRGVAVVFGLLLILVGGSTDGLAQVRAIFPGVAKFDLRNQITATPQLASFAIPLRTAPLTSGPIAAPSPLVQPAPAPAAPSSIPATTSNLASVPLSALVDANSFGDLDEEATCLATAVYFESKGEPLEGQLAVAQVVMNRAASGRFPASLCGVVKQRAQFSFVRAGNFPSHDPNCDGWRKARAIARIAQKHLVPTVPTNVLWYHANYVTPRWRQALTKVEQIGQHIFYSA